MSTRALHSNSAWRVALAVALVACVHAAALAQPEYFIRDTTVTDCEGVLYDSELGVLAGHYDHNEDYRFSICVAGADRIELNFSFYHSEEQYDQIWFYDGPDDSAPLIAGPYSGRTDIPLVVATSGCLTVRFATDANVAEPGWRAQWRTSNFDPPTAPEITLAATPVCPVAELLVDLDRAVHCDSLYAGAVTLIGPKVVAITSVEPVGCSGDSARKFRVRFTPELDFGGRYRLRLRTIVPYCTTPYILTSQLEFVLTGCPLAIRLLVSDADELCVGDYTRVRAEVTGGIRSTYVYDWSPTPSPVDTVRVGPINGPTIVTLNVRDATGAAATASVTITPNAAPVIVGGDRRMCQSVDAFLLEAQPPGGQWVADGMYYGYDRYQRLYEPQLTDGVRDVITYEAPNGCTAEATYTFTELDYGTDDGACPGADPFQVSGGSPAGGVWTGPNVAPDGTFTPPAAPGTFTVTYQHPNGCSGSKEVHIAVPSAIAQDTFCESEPRVELAVEPRGGVWTGPGVTFGDRDWFSPGRAGAGPHTLTYFAEGCGQRDVEVFVKEIDAAEGFTACPIEDARILPGNWRPAGGTWYGRGIVEPTLGLFDPKLFGTGTDTLTYHAPNGCSDRRTASVFFTFVRPGGDTLELCTADAPVQLTPGGAYFQRPLDGEWSGTGVRYSGGEAYFDPAEAGPGIHDLSYEANTCAAPVVMRVGQSPDWLGDTLCVGTDPVMLRSAAPGTEWTGPGIVNPLDGVFDVSVSGTGFHEVFALSPEGCEQTAMVYVPDEAQLSFAAPDEVLCFGVSPLDLQLAPSDTRLFRNNVPLPQNLSSALLDTGVHVVTLRAGVVGCEDVDSFRVQVLPPLSLSAKPYRDTLCYGEGTRLELEADGGLVAERRLSWTDLGSGQLYARTVAPLRTTRYTALLDDGCSDQARLELDVLVHPEVGAEVFEGPTVCYVDSTSTTVLPVGGSSYSVAWATDSGTVEAESYLGRPGIYEVRVTDQATGCALDTAARLPGYEPIVASFTANPNDCVAPGSTPVTLLDRSRGAATGTWTLPGGSTQPYVLGDNVAFVPLDTGSFDVVLRIANAGGCRDSLTVPVCVRETSALWLPNAFTPNGDGTNDAFRIAGTGIYDVEWLIVDRWGTVVFRGDDLDASWDGTHEGQLVAGGRYTLRARYLDNRGQWQQQAGMVQVLR